MIDDLITELVDCLCLKITFEKEQGKAPDYLVMHIEDLKERIKHASVDSQ